MTGMRTRVESCSEDETRAAGAALALRLSAGAWVLLSGGLGAGKTAFIRGMAEGLGVDPAEVSSPTFTLVHEYRGRLPLAHVDLYRVAEGDVEELGLDELASAGGIVAVEWAERLARGVRGAIRVDISDLGDDRRAITIEETASDYSDR